MRETLGCGVGNVLSLGNVSSRRGLAKLSVIVGFIFLSLVLLMVGSCAEIVSAKDVAYVVKTSSNVKTNVISSIEALGYSYDVIPETSVLSTNFSNYGMIIVQDTLLVTYRNGLPLATKSIIFMDKNIAPLVWPASSITSTSTFTSKFEQLGTPFTDGLFDINFNAYTATKGIFYLKVKPSYVGRVALTTSSAGNYGIVSYSSSVNLRRVMFGFYEVDSWTANTTRLFKNALKWTREGVDFDGDGYFSDVDCNDTNKDVWRNLSGYVDADRDRYGSDIIGSVSVCSGNILPVGYYNIAGDCNDNSSNIKPGAIEVPYNGIDENCDGKDLRDVDGDGFDAVVVGGTDCNDNDRLINPNSTDVYRNCKNDAPIITGFSPKMIVSETENVTVYVSAIDPENDSLTYTVNDSRFVQNLSNKNEFSWQTSYDDKGKHFVTLTVSDGVLNASKVIEISVLGTNRAPTCSEIPAIEWNEDSGHFLNLMAYCSDPDGDPLSFSINSTSENKNITIVELGYAGEGKFDLIPESDWSGEDWVIFTAYDSDVAVNTNKVSLKVNPVNDAPLFVGNISDIFWNEDVNLTDYIDLNEYFTDIDSELSYNVTKLNENSSINVQINSYGEVSFYPLKDWAGNESVIFSATDGEFVLNSNIVTLSVADLNEPPVFGEMNCSLEILEDSTTSCALNVSDFENNPLSFSVVSSNHVICTVDSENLTLTYTPSLNYNGNANCMIKVSDVFNGSSTYNLALNVLPVNDAFEIVDYSPKGILKFMENSFHTFSINVSDVDGTGSVGGVGSVGIKWLLNSEDIANASEARYIFNKPKGIYNLTAFASDGEFNASQIWNILVGNNSDFTCSELRGKVCTSTQVCSENVTSSSDSSSCCFANCIARPPTFEKIAVCSVNKSSRYNLEISSPDSGDDFYVGSNFSVTVNVDDNLNDDKTHRYDVIVYLYDLTNQKIIDDSKQTIRLDSGNEGDYNFDFSIDEDLDSGNSYAVYAKSNDRINGSCYDDYVAIEIKRKNDEVRIDSLNMKSYVFNAGDSVDFRANVKNYGADDNIVTLKVESKGLGLYKIFDSVDLDGNGGKNDEEDVLVSFDIPSNASSGDYRFDVVASYAGSLKYTYSETLTVEGGEVLNPIVDNPISYNTIELNPSSLSLSPSTINDPVSSLIGGNLSSLEDAINLNGADLDSVGSNAGPNNLTGYLAIIAIVIFIIAAVVFSFVI